MFAAGKTTSGVASQTYVDDVFSTYLYGGNNTAQSINNGIALTSTAAWSAGKLQQNGSVGRGIATDTSGNVYVNGVANDGTNNYISISKYNNSGVIQWQRKLQQANSLGFGIATDTSGNVYVTGYALDGTSNYISISKYNTSGVIQWQRKLAQSTSYGYGIAVDTSGNVYVTGQADDGNTYISISKYNNSGVIQWQRKLSQSLGGVGSGIATDTSGNVYVTGAIYDGTNNYISISKYNTSGVIQWQRKLQQGNSSGQGIATDTSGNVYVTGHAYDGSNTYISISKYNTSGVIQWQRKLKEGNSLGYGIATDSSGNVYVTGLDNDGANYISISKYNTSGVIQWQRKLRQNDSYGLSIATDTSGNVYVTGYANDGTNNYISIIKLAQDGSTISGIANNLQMTVGIATDSAGTATDSAGTATDSAGTATDSAGTATDSAGPATYTYGTQAAVTSNGGLVWLKSRSAATDHALYDTMRGATFDLVSNSTAAQTTQATGLTTFNANGFSIGLLNKLNTSGSTYASWTFREAPKFFDVVTYTGTGANRTVAHNLGSVPGMIITKRTDTTGNWITYHRSLGNTDFVNLNTTAVTTADSGAWNNTSPTSTDFSLGTGNTNVSGGTYVAYLFAHDTATDGIIQCGSWTGTGTAQQITLGWEPQFILAKNASSPDNWFMIDTMRSWPATVSSAVQLYANSSSAEVASNKGAPNATGFSTAGYGEFVGNVMIYIAIRRPNKPPTTGTQVFSPIASSAATGTALTTNFPVDMQIGKYLSGTSSWSVVDRLRGVSTTSTEAGLSLATNSTAAEGTSSGSDSNNWGSTGFLTPTNLGGIYSLFCNFRRAPGVFDEVCYNGNGTTQQISHNLGSVPQLILIKGRNFSANWGIYNVGIGNAWALFFTSAAKTSVGPDWWGNGTIRIDPTATNFTVGAAGEINTSGGTHVAYLFATSPGISKVFSYTGNGTSQTINCGFTTGARFVLIKRTDSTGDWYVWNSAMGIFAGNDPHVSLNTTAAAVNTDDSVDTDSTGFIVNQLAATNVNVTSATYIGLAFA